MSHLEPNSRHPQVFYSSITSYDFNLGFWSLILPEFPGEAGTSQIGSFIRDWLHGSRV